MQGVLIISALYTKCPYDLVLFIYMQSVLEYSALNIYASCPFNLVRYIVIYTQSVLVLIYSGLYAKCPHYCI